MKAEFIQEMKSIFESILGGESQKNLLKNEEKLGDEADVMFFEKETQLNLRLLSRDGIYLKKVRKSLQKIQDGHFGECEDCGEEIGEARLRARPVSDLCIHCKELEEKSEAQLIHKNRKSVLGSKNQILPIRNIKSVTQESNMSFKVEHMDYQDVVN